jgi:hypothetical protein
VPALQTSAIQTPTPPQIIARYHTSVPVNVLGIAKDLGLNVWGMDLPANISGKIFRDPKNGGPSGFSVAVNSTEPAVRQRFTIAHEVSHFLLHRLQLENGDLVDDTMYRSGLSSKEETAANDLAAHILMPMTLINKLVSEGVKDVVSLAERFQVSLTAMRIRLGIPT